MEGADLFAHATADTEQAGEGMEHALRERTAGNVGIEMAQQPDTDNDRQCGRCQSCDLHGLEGNHCADWIFSIISWYCIMPPPIVRL